MPRLIISWLDRIIQSFKSLTQEPLKDLQNAIQGSDEMVEKWFRQLMAEQQQSMFESKSIAVLSWESLFVLTC